MRPAPFASPFLLCSFLAGCGSPGVLSTPPQVFWANDMLSIRQSEIPGGEVKVWYLEAYCRSGSTKRVWSETTIPHRTEKLEESPDGRSLRLRCRVEGGLEVLHDIRAVPDGVEFDVEARNRGTARVDAVWVQPCIRLGAFTGATQESYVERSFIFVDGRRTFLSHARRTEDAIYRGGQVYVPAGIDRADVNPRPISPDVPSNGLIGCVSGDGRFLLATAWEPYQELFQGVAICLHSDFRLGGIEPGQVKLAKGKIYIVPNDVDDLLTRYRRDFARPRHGPEHQRSDD